MWGYFTRAGYTCQQVNLTHVSGSRTGSHTGSPVDTYGAQKTCGSWPTYTDKRALHRERESPGEDKRRRGRWCCETQHTQHTHTYTHTMWSKGKKQRRNRQRCDWKIQSQQSSLWTLSHTQHVEHTHVYTHTQVWGPPPQSHVLKCSINILYTRVPPVSPGTPLKCKEKKKTLSNNIRASRGRKRTHQFKRQCRQKIRLIFIMSRGIYIH